MAYYETGTYTTGSDLLQAMATFVATNGWTVDLSTAVSTNWRLHIHLGTSHYSMQSNGTTIYLYGCTGYDSGSAYNAQPGTSSVRTLSLTAGRAYWLTSAVGAIHVFIEHTSATCVITLGDIANKIGTWTGGQLVHGSSNSSYMGWSSSAWALMQYDGSWTSASAAGITGSVGRDAEIVEDFPCTFNGAFLPVPIVVFLGLPADTTKLQPCGYVPGLYHSNGGDIYSPGDIVTIGSDNYYWIPGYSGAIGNALNGDYLVKLGA